MSKRRGGDHIQTEFELDAWSRFERAVDVVAKSPPQHRTKPSGKRKARKRKAKKPGR